MFSWRVKRVVVAKKIFVELKEQKISDYEFEYTMTLLQTQKTTWYTDNVPIHWATKYFQFEISIIQIYIF